MSTSAVVNIASPFQLFTAFTENDRDKFFGREEEIAILNQLIQEANVMLVYGESGTGKTSLVQCGLLNETKHFNWSIITIRRMENINAAFREKITRELKTEDSPEKITSLVHKIFLDSFQPILLIFDQFEELFVFGTEDERVIFYKDIKAILKLGIPCKMIFIMREEYIARLTEFEKYAPNIFRKQLRIELINKTRCREIIVKSCRRFGIVLSPLREKEDGPECMDAPGKILATVPSNDNKIHLPYMQVFLDTLWRKAYAKDPDLIRIDENIVEEVGNMGNVLKAFLEEKAENQKDVSKLDIWKLLKLFVPEKGSTRKRIRLSDYTAIPSGLLKRIFDYLEENKVISSCGGDLYELAHDSLVPIIQNIKISEIRPRLLEPAIKGNPYKGLESYGQKDNDRFYGRREVIKAVYEKVKQQALIVIAGNSGAGKSSLIKAGVFPLMEKDGYEILDTVQKEAIRGENSLRSLEHIVQKIQGKEPGKKYILLIDQYEELITRVADSKVRQQVTEKIYELVLAQTDHSPDYELKIIITVRADFEPQFSILKPLNIFWKSGKYIVPPFTREEICEIIEEPAYQAGLEFSPPSLIDKIADEVYSSQATGLLPLMSFTLSELYKEYVNRGKDDKLLRESDYNELGGVIGGLQTRGDKMYRRYRTDFPADYERYQYAMKNIMLRMVYMAAGELAGQRVLEEDLVFSSEETNNIVSKVLKDLEDSHLILSKEGKDGKKYFEPAHDVLVRTWGQIWDWIGSLQKDTLFLQGRLSQATIDYEKSKETDGLLWDQSPWLADLEKIYRSEDNWLNKKETLFIDRSIAKRNKAIAAAKKQQEKKSKKNKVVVSILAGTILVGVIVAMYVMRSMARSTNTAYSALAIVNADTISDRKFALGLLKKARDLFKHGNLNDNLVSQALNTSDKQIVKVFNKGDLNCRVITPGETSLQLFGYELFANDSRILAVYNGSANSILSVLYDANGDSIISWPHKAFHVENSDLVAVIDSPKIIFYRDRVKGGLPVINRNDVLNRKSNVVSGVSTSSRHNILIQTSAGPFLLRDSLSKMQGLLDTADKNVFSTSAVFLKNGDILKVESINKPQKNKSYQGASSTIRVRLIMGNASSHPPAPIDVDMAVISSNKEKVLVKIQDKWAFLDPTGLKYLASAVQNAQLQFDEKGDLLMYDNDNLVLYDPDGNLKTVLRRDLTGYGIIDFYDTLVLLFKSTISQLNPLADKASADSVLLLDLSSSPALPAPFISGTGIKDLRLGNNGRELILVSKDDSQTESPSLFEVYAIRQKRRLVSFRLYVDETSFIQVLNRNYSRATDQYFPVILGNPFGATPRIQYFNSFYQWYGDNFKKLKLYDAQYPVVRFSDNADSIVSWINRTLSSDQKKVDDYLHYKKSFDWLPF